MLAGLYGDVCVDATARSGFQKGFWISVVRGGVGMLYGGLGEWERFVGRVYGGRVVGVEDLMGEEGVGASVGGRAKL